MRLEFTNLANFEVSRKLDHVSSALSGVLFEEEFIDYSITRYNIRVYNGDSSEAVLLASFPDLLPDDGSSISDLHSNNRVVKTYTDGQYQMSSTAHSLLVVFDHNPDDSAVMAEDPIPRMQAAYSEAWCKPLTTLVTGTGESLQQPALLRYRCGHHSMLLHLRPWQQ